MYKKIIQQPVSHRTLERVKLVILDLGGVIRDTSRGLDAGYRMGFESEGLPYNYNYQNTWHLRGIGKYDIATECFKVLLALELRGESQLLPQIIKLPDAESVLDDIAKKTLSKDDILTAERIRLKYKEFFNSENAKEFISLYPFAERSVKSLSEKGYKIALLTNGNRVTVYRDVPFASAFDLILSEDDVREKKPSGEGIRKIMATFGFNTDQTIFVCDASVDIKAAKDAGSMSAAVLSGMGLEIHLKKENPELIVKDLAEFNRIMHAIRRN